MSTQKPATKEMPVLLFEDQEKWANWLELNESSLPGVWLRLAKKAADLKSVSYDEAVETALCHGWIDGQKKSFDESSWLQKFTPRGSKSIWSKINRAKAEKLIQTGQMKPSGLLEIENARQNGRWDGAYDSHTSATIPDDFQKELDLNPQARAFFSTLNSQNRYAILFRLQTALKAETRAKRLEKFIKMLENSEKLYP